MTDKRLSEAEIDDCLTGLDQIALPYRTVWRLTPFADYLLVVARAIRQLSADLKAALDQAHNATADLSRAAEAAGLAPYGGAWNPERLVPAIMSLREKAERQVGQFRADLAAARAETDPIRRRLWLGHGCPMPALYGDDGEMSCNACMIDFRRDSWSTIESALIQRDVRHAARTSEER